MYTELDLAENQKMEEIIKENKLKVQEFNKKRNRKQWKEALLTNALMILGSSTFTFGLMFLVAIIENLKF